MTSMHSVMTSMMVIMQTRRGVRLFTTHLHRLLPNYDSATPGTQIYQQMRKDSALEIRKLFRATVADSNSFHCNTMGTILFDELKLLLQVFDNNKQNI